MDSELLISLFDMIYTLDREYFLTILRKSRYLSRRYIELQCSDHYLGELHRSHSELIEIIKSEL